GMAAEAKVLIPTPLFLQALESAGLEFDFGTTNIFFDPSKPKEMLLAFRLLSDTKKKPSVCVLDIGCFRDETQWAFVSDAVGHSGNNPLRGLGRVMREPFVDVSRLYHVPPGATGTEVIALGDRYQEHISKCQGTTHPHPVCSHLHSAAILAHTEGLHVTAALVSEVAIPNFNIDQLVQE
ncbi:hypothetical protein ACFL6Q_07115, partial [Candidatus Neomarinimicrobiota bacterium]